MHALDNVIWRALTTRQAQFAECFEQARRFVRELTSLCAFEEPSLQGYAALGELAGARGTAAVFLDSPYEARPGWALVAGAPLLEMVCEDSNGRQGRSDSAPQIIRLGAGDAVEGDIDEARTIRVANA